MQPISHAVENLGGLQVQSGRKRRHGSSSDSSLLKPAIKQSTMLITEEGKGRSTEWLGIHPPHSHKKRKVEPSDPGTSTPSTARQETFEKRARHKTREDRYVPKKEKNKPGRNNREKEPRAKRLKKGDGKRAARRAGEDLMNSFASKSIGPERLTVRMNLH